MSNPIRYRDYLIRHNPKPVASSRYDYDFAHVDYDGAPDAKDNRCGCAASVAEAKQEIDDIEGVELRCHFCGTGCESVARAVALDWVPSFYEPGSEIETCSPVCPACCAEHLEVGADGELEQVTD